MGDALDALFLGEFGDLLDQALVELGAFAERAQPHLLAEARREVAHQARETAEHRLDRQHAHADHRFLQVAGVALEQIQTFEQTLGEGGVEPAADLLEHRLGDDQLADQVEG